MAEVIVKTENFENKDEETGNKPKIAFRKKVKRNLRRRLSDDEVEKGDEVAAKGTLDEIKERQRLRERPSGISLTGLALGKKIAAEEELASKDPFLSINGGLINMQALKSGKLGTQDDAYEISIGTQFSVETNKRDEDEEMMKFIDKELKKRKGLDKDEAEDAEPQQYISPEEAALMALPDHLRQSSTNRSEEMLSNQMLNGIPEVDLGIDAKIKNIEATEEAKHKIMLQQMSKKDGPSHFVPANMAVNFMQHNRFILDDEQKKRKREQEQMQYNQRNPNGQKRATDDYHYDKFKKQFRRF